MISNNTLGIIFANVHDDLIPELTEKRSMASIPFGGRYRLIDFSLSNLVNAGIDKVGIITKENYRSLMDHLGNGKPWDLDRKNDGIFILPPYSTNQSGFFKGHVDALAGIINFLTRSREEYVVMCDADVVSNIDIRHIITQHCQANADVTVVYKHGTLPLNHQDTMIISTNSDGFVSQIDMAEKMNEEVNFSLDIFVIRRELLIEWITDASRKNLVSLSRDVFLPRINEIRMYAVESTDFAEVVDSTESYVRISRSLLNRDIRNRLFGIDRPVYTKTRDDMPTRYGVNSSVKNSLVANGCVIEGKLENSILFRGVTVGEGSVVENCIIMQGTKIGKNSHLKNVTIDKAACVGDGITLMGSDEKNIFIGKEKRL